MRYYPAYWQPGFHISGPQLAWKSQNGHMTSKIIHSASRKAVWSRFSYFLVLWDGNLFTWCRELGVYMLCGLCLLFFFVSGLLLTGNHGATKYSMAVVWKFLDVETPSFRFHDFLIFTAFRIIVVNLMWLGGFKFSSWMVRWLFPWNLIQENQLFMVVSIGWFQVLT